MGFARSAITAALRMIQELRKRDTWIYTYSQGTPTISFSSKGVAGLSTTYTVYREVA